VYTYHYNYSLAVGSVLLVYAGRKSDDGCFLQLSEDSTLSGFTIYYPDQVPDQVPLPYPWYMLPGGELIKSVEFIQLPIDCAADNQGQCT